MFGIFKKKHEPTVLDGLIKLTYGDTPPKKTENPQEAIRLAHQILLGGVIPFAEVETAGIELFRGPFPYSTHDLAVATAMNLIRSSTGSRRAELARMWMQSRTVLVDWVREKKVAPLIAQTFEDTLRKEFKKDASSLKSTKPNYLEAGKVLAAALMDADDCWRDVCCLREYEVPDCVANCEMAFARAAIIRHAIRTSELDDMAAAQMLVGLKNYVAEAFADGDVPETLEYYEGERLVTVAPGIIQYYEENAFPLTQLADALANRLSVPGLPSLDIAPLFEKTAFEADQLLKLSSALEKFGRG